MGAWECEVGKEGVCLPHQAETCFYALCLIGPLLLLGGKRLGDPSLLVLSLANAQCTHLWDGRVWFYQLFSSSDSLMFFSLLACSWSSATRPSSSTWANFLLLPSDTGPPCSLRPGGLRVPLGALFGFLRWLPRAAYCTHGGGHCYSWSCHASSCSHEGCQFLEGLCAPLGFP